MTRHAITKQTYVAVHEECMPEYIERLFLISRAVTPRQQTDRQQRAMERDFVSDILKRQWGITFLFLERQATDRLFYKNINTSRNGQRMILFTNIDKIRQNFRYVPMVPDVPWQGLTVVVKLDNDQSIVLGEPK